jgi:hypothetical protein
MKVARSRMKVARSRMKVTRGSIKAKTQCKAHRASVRGGCLPLVPRLGIPPGTAVLPYTTRHSTHTHTETATAESSALGDTEDDLRPPNGLSLSCTARAHVPKPTRHGGCRRGVAELRLAKLQPS